MPAAYDPSRKALLTPARDVTFFAEGRPPSEAVLCAEMSRLAYAPFEREATARSTVETVLKEIGFASVTCFSSESTEAILAEDRALPLTVLVFRGTELDPRDWATDLNAVLTPWRGGGAVHAGFAEALESVWDEVNTALAGVTGRLIYTGHSLGAALATLAASLRAPQALYTYGSPRVGDTTFAAAIAPLEHHRYTNCCDVVCRIPPESFGYVHTGRLRYLDRHGILRLRPSAKVIRRDRRRARGAYLLEYAWRWGTMWTRDMADHAPVNYLTALRMAGGGAG